MRHAASLVVLMIASFAAAPLLASDDPAQKKDLAAVIALNGMPCGEVVSYVAKGDKDFIATCKDGNKYRVFVNAEGRVVVEKTR